MGMPSLFTPTLGLVYCINGLSNELVFSSNTHRKPWNIKDAHERLVIQGRINL